MDTLLEDFRGIPKLSNSAVEVRDRGCTISSPVPVLASRPLESSGGLVYGVLCTRNSNNCMY